MKNFRHLFVVAMGIGLYSNTASAFTCTIDIRTNLIEDGIEADASVPNYAQGSFVGPNDCGPTAFAMIAGFWDANGWPGIVTGPSTYSELADPPFGVDAIVDRLQDDLPYYTAGLNGTWSWESLTIAFSGDIGEDALQSFEFNEPQAGSWTARDDNLPSKQMIRNNISKRRPVALMVTSPDPFEDWVWSNGESGHKDVSLHWMPILGYEDRVIGRGLVGWCDDDLAVDDFYIVTRSGWKAGGDTMLWYNWSGIDLGDFYTVELVPTGQPTVREDLLDEDQDSFGAMEVELGLTPGLDCDDSNQNIQPGAFEECDGLDNDCDGAIDEGSPDWDDDGVRNECDLDDDNDGVDDDFDNCPFGSNSSQADADSDGIGDPCDFCPEDSANDSDDDGLCAEDDNCPGDSNPEQQDLDGDGQGDACDLDIDGDGVPNFSDADDDGDGIPDIDDNCPRIVNSNQVDHDGNGVGLACDDAEAFAQLTSRMEALLDSLLGDLQYLEIEALQDGWRPPKGPGCPACSSPWKDAYAETYKAAPKLTDALIAKDGSLSGEDLLSVIVELEPDLEAAGEAYFAEEGFIVSK